MKKTEKEAFKRALPITKVIAFYGARHISGDLWRCFLHEDKHPSLIANDNRGVATCESSKCRLPRGSDIFEVIKTAEGKNFAQAVDKARALINTTVRVIEEKAPYAPKLKETNKDLSSIPTTSDLRPQHISWLQRRYGAEWAWLVEKFSIKGWHNHLAIPITSQSTVFVPLDKARDQTFYRGRVRTPQVFPNFPIPKSCQNIIKVEGEKDLLKVTAHIHQHNLDEHWLAITNTNGANSLKSLLSKDPKALFENFDPVSIKQVIIAHDNDLAGHKANQVALVNAKEYFNAETRINVLELGNNINGYDITDYINDGQTFLPGKQISLFPEPNPGENQVQYEVGLSL